MSRQCVYKKRADDGAEQGDWRFGEGDLQHAAGLALLTGLTGFAVLGRGAHVLAAIFIHHRHAHGFHRARFCGCLNTRHSAKGKREADQQDEAKPQIAFHGDGV